AVLGGEDDALRAARLLGASAALRPDVFHISSLEREIRDAGAGAARAVMGAEAYERAYAEGAGLSLAEAAALV
ncbi:hypothetical protein, partial [Streptomyces alboverticillatus]